MKKIIILALSVLFVLGVLSCDGSVYSSLVDSSDSKSMPLSIEAKDADLTVTVCLNLFSSSEVKLKYSLDGGSTTTAITSSTQVISVPAGKTICFYGDRNADGSDGNSVENSKCVNINCDQDCYVYGNVMSLLDSTNFATNTVIGYTHAFDRLFEGNTHIDIHETYDLVLPATTLTYECYRAMFINCTGLTKAPELPATTLAENCYRAMFNSCKGLTEAPVLPATTLKSWCYEGMFDGCTNLNAITCLATDISAENCTNCWLNNVASLGTFKKASSMTSWTTGTSGIPLGWTPQDYTE